MTRINLRKVSPTKRYTIRELADKLGITTRAVYFKLKDGLRSFIMKKKLHILGEEFIDYEKAKRERRKQPLKEYEFWCCCCKNKRKPKNNEVRVKDFTQSEKRVNKNSLLLIATCPVCRNKMFKISNTSKLDNFDILFKIVQ